MQNVVFEWSCTTGLIVFNECRAGRKLFFRATFRLSNLGLGYNKRTLYLALDDINDVTLPWNNKRILHPKRYKIERGNSPFRN